MNQCPIEQAVHADDDRPTSGQPGSGEAVPFPELPDHRGMNRQIRIQAGEWVGLEVQNDGSIVVVLRSVVRQQRRARRHSIRRRT